MTASDEAIRPGAAEAPVRKRPQRRVGTFTLGVTLVACGGAMLSALCFPAIPPERFLQGPVRELRISYHREVPMGETLEVFSCPAGEGAYFLGRGGDGDCFEALVTF